MRAIPPEQPHRKINTLNVKSHMCTRAHVGL